MVHVVNVCVWCVVLGNIESVCVVYGGGKCDECVRVCLWDVMEVYVVSVCVECGGVICGGCRCVEYGGSMCGGFCVSVGYDGVKCFVSVCDMLM